MSSTYLIALGSNRRHRVYGSPREVVGAAMEEISALGTVTARSAVIATDPLGPAQRRFANAACILDSEYDPPAMLAGLKRLENEFGRRQVRRWGDRVIDCDIVLWSGGRYSSDRLVIPHPEFRKRDFVLVPAGQVAPGWRDPETGFSIRQHITRLTRPRGLPS